ncbi:MAG: malectin domain-containing carbohydrate-binding protein [Adhaeribacter sp.]
MSCWLGARQALAQNATFSFSPSGLQGVTLTNPTSLQFGPDGRLYVSQQNGIIKAFTITRKGVNNYEVTATETINLINQIPNHNDDGTLATWVTSRQVTGIVVAGTAASPILYVSSSDSRIGGPDGDKNLDTNSGTISRLSKSGSSWTKVDLVRGLPRSEENHSVNGMEFDPASNMLYLAVGGLTNAGAPSTNFAYITEYALSAAILSINLTAIDQLPTKGSGNMAYKYDLPTVDDPTRSNNADGTDVNDPFGGNDGLNQAKVVAGGPVQVYSPGYRNPYDLVITRTPGKAGRMYTIDNGANQGWGGQPDHEGSLGLTTNNYVVGEPGSTGPSSTDPQVNNLDNLHYIGNVATYVPGSHYGGHPTPIRANPNGAGLYTFSGGAGVWRTSKTGTNPLPADWPPVPASMANPIEGDYRQPGLHDAALLTFSSSVNGLTEYRASNFNNALKGTLLAAGYNGSIYKILPTADGTAVTNKLASWSNSKVNEEPAFATGFGSQPLDIVAQGDDDIFPGTVWAATYGNHAITIFEPQDLLSCTGTYSLTLDEDGDGYTNADEIDNLSDPCSASSKPEDVDKDLLSDRNDPDDDNDGLPDNTDYFALDAANGMATQLPVYYELFNNDPGTGLFGLGFTGLMNNGTATYTNQFAEANLIAGGAVGAFSVVEVPAGDALGSLNSQKNGFQFGLNVDASQGPFTVQGRMVGPFFNNAIPQNFKSQGFYIGTGDQDNYLKIALNANGGLGGIEVLYEVGGVATSVQYPLTGGMPGTSVDLYFAVNPQAGTVQPRYAQDNGQVINLGAPISVSGALLTAIQSSPALAVGVISTSRASTVFTATWDFIRVTADPVTATGGWQTLAPVSGSATERSENAYVQAGDKFYLIGGRGNKAVQAYDPVNKTWTDKAGTPMELHHFQAVTLNGLIYVAGAFTGNYPHETPVPNLLVYNPATDKWVTGSTIPESRRRGSAGVVVYNNKLYLVGGIQDGHWTGNVPWLDEFDPATNTWKALADAPRVRDHFQAALADGKIYVAGGRLTSGITGHIANYTIGEVDVYDFATGSWSTLPAGSNLPTKRAGAATAMLGDELLVIGGETTNAAANKETEALNVKTHTWRRLADLNQARHATQAIVNNNGVYLAAGSGAQGGGPELNSQESFFLFAPSTPQGTALTASTLTGPASLDFDAIATGGSSSKVITLSNVGGNQAILVHSVVFSGSSAYSYVAPFLMPFQLGVGKSVNINVIFKPLTAGSQPGTLVIGHSGAGQTTTINLSGEGVATGLTASPGNLHFFSQQAGTTSASQAITVTNSGTTERLVSSVIIAGTNSSEFAYSTPGSLTLAPGASTEVAISFKPASLGTKVAQVQISDADGSSNLVVGLTGEGVDNPPVVPAAHRINAGGPEVTNVLGIFAADNFFAPATGHTYSTTNAISGTQNDNMYQTERSSAENNGSFAYSLPVGSGQYTVVLHFAELYWNAPGQRLFDVSLEGSKVLDNYDIFAKTGAKYAATTESFMVSVADGSVDLLFSALSSEDGLDRPKVSAIEIIPAEGTNLFPLANAGADKTITLPLSSVVLDGAGSDADGTVSSYSWNQVSGPSLASFSNREEAAPTVSGLMAGTYVFSLTVKDDQQAISAADQVSVTVYQDPAAPVVVAAHRINAGGAQTTNSKGTFAADQYFAPAPGHTYATTTAIAGTQDDAMYQTERSAGADNGSFGYDLPLANGQYTVVLHFAELYWNAAGKRVFDVALEGVKVLDNYDIVQKAGANFTAQIETFMVEVNDGSLNLSFSALASEGGVNRPKVSAIEVIPFSGVNTFPIAQAGTDKTITLPLSSVVLDGAGSDADGTVASYAWTQVSGPVPATFSSTTVATPTVEGLIAGTYVFSLTVKDDQGAISAADQVSVTVNPDPNAVPDLASHRINAGGGQSSNSLGLFSADALFAPAPGYTFSTNNPIAATSDDAIYQTERSAGADNGAFSYALPVSSGQYTVVLHFAELYWTSAGKRVFDVTMEGGLVLDNYDIVQKAGANFTATTESFVVSVTDGSLDILFSALASEGGVNRPKVSAIEVIPFEGNNSFPLAQAGADKIITLPLNSVVLDGAGSDADGTVASYAWTQVSGPVPATFSSTTVATPTVGGLIAGSYVFSLAVKDDQQALSAADQVTVTVNPDPSAPVVVATYRLNAGGNQLSNSIGTFAADNFFAPAPGFTYSTANPIAGTFDDAMYQTERSAGADNGSFSYALPVSSGQYTVVLHFAELYWQAAGQRVFDVTTEGFTVLDNYDIFAKTGAKFMATTESFVVDVTDGVLDIGFSSLAGTGGVNRPKVSAIEVIPYQGSAQARVSLAGTRPAGPQTTESGISAYPNPFQQDINLKMDGAAAGSYTVKILDVVGRQLMKTSFELSSATSQTQVISLSGISLTSGGFYLVVVEGAQGKFRQVIKMMKN